MRDYLLASALIVFLFLLILIAIMSIDNSIQINKLKEKNADRDQRVSSIESQLDEDVLPAIDRLKRSSKSSFESIRLIRQRLFRMEDDSK